MSEEHIGPTNGNGTGREVVPFDGVDPRGVVGTDFLMYAVGGGANIEAQVDYQTDPQRSSGALPGVARSNFTNKAVRQGTFVAHSLCLWISQQLQLYIPDDGNDIAWIGSFQSALSSVILAAIPPGPNLGAYLPLVGGTMVGHIYFQPGITTILSNNTWYYGKDTGGTARGLILKGTDNNVYINDGSAPYVVIQGAPRISNNVAYQGNDTGGTPYRLIGQLSDNAVHIGGGATGHIYLDCTLTGSVWCTSNVVIPNNFSYYCKSTDGNARAILSMTTANALLIGSGAPGSTEIYAASGSVINAHVQFQSLSTFVAYGYSYLTGGRAYIPGGNDPWQVYADNGYYARTRFVVGGTRDWSVGVLPGSGVFCVADESGAAIRMQIDLAGTTTIYGNVDVQNTAFVRNQLQVWNSIIVQTGYLSVAGGVTIGGGLTCYGGLSLVTGNLSMNGDLGCAGHGQFNNGLLVYNSLNVASGRLDVAGATGLAGGLTVSGGLNVPTGNVTFAGTLAVSGYTTLGGGLAVYNGLAVVSGSLTSNYIISYGAAQVNNGLTVYNSINIATGGFNVEKEISYLKNQLQVWNHIYLWTGDFHVPNGSSVIGGNESVGNTLFVYNQAQVYNWVVIKSGGLSVEAGDMNCSSQLSVGGVGYIYAGLNVWNSLIVQTGNLTVNGGVGIGGGLTVYNGFNVETGNAQVPHGSFWTGGNLEVSNTAFIRNQLQAWNYIICQTGDVQIPNGSVVAGGGLFCNGGSSIGGGLTVYNNMLVATGWFTVNGAATVSGGLTVSGVNCTGDLNVGNTLFVRNQAQVWNEIFIFSGSLHVEHGNGYFAGDVSVGNTCFVHNQLQVWNWVEVFTGGVHVHDGNGILVDNGGGLDLSGHAWIHNGADIWNGCVIQSGRLTAGGDCYVNNGLTVYNGLWIHNGGLDCDGTGYIHNGLNVWNSAVIQSGVLQCNSDCNVNGWVHAGGVTSGDTHLGNTWVAQLAIGGLSWIYDRGDGMLVMQNNTNFLNNIWVNGTVTSSNINNGDQLHTNWVFTNALQNYGSEQINGNCTVNGGMYAGGVLCYGGCTINNGLNVWNGINSYGGRIYTNTEVYAEGGVHGLGMTTNSYGYESGGNIWMRGSLNGWNSQLQWTGNGGRGYGIQAVSDWLYFGWNNSQDIGYAQPSIVAWMFAVNAGGIQVLGGTAYKPGGGSWDNSTSQRQYKKDIADYDRGLDALMRLRPRTYRFNGTDIAAPDDGKTYTGFILDEVEDVMPEMVHDYDRGCVHGIMRTLDTSPLIYAMLNAMKEMAARIEVLEGGRA